jgi:hypothetical protein
VIDADERWVTGDHFGLSIPVDPAALRAGGTAFLTRALRASGALAADNAVARITGFQEVPGGSTGRKLLLRIEYEKPRAHPHRLVREVLSRFGKSRPRPREDANGV